LSRFRESMLDPRGLDTRFRCAWPRLWAGIGEIAPRGPRHTKAFRLTYLVGLGWVVGFEPTATGTTMLVGWAPTGICLTGARVCPDR